MGEEDDTPQTFCLSPLYQDIISKLIATSERSDAGSSNLRNAAYEAIMDMIKYSPKVSGEPHTSEVVVVMVESVWCGY